MKYHNPVLLNESVAGLNIIENGIYVDVTFGGGGHSSEILKRLNEKGRLFGFDQDPDALGNVIDDVRFVLIPENFRYISRFLRFNGVRKVDGVLADLGVSSHQFDVAERGFSTRFDGELDMRMNTNSLLSAKQVVNEYCQQDLANILFKYAELRNSRAIAREIVNAREIETIVTTNQLIDVVGHMVPEKNRNQFLARIFQAIRIEVNDEMKALEEMLLDAVDMLNEGGRLVVMSYHSLEDRMVKNLMKKGNIEGVLEKDFFGNPIKDLKEVTRKVIVATKDQIMENKRARSAKLRIAEKG